MYFRPDFCLLFAFRGRLFDREVQHQSTDLKDPSLNPSKGVFEGPLLFKGSLGS